MSIQALFRQAKFKSLNSVILSNIKHSRTSYWFCAYHFCCTSSYLAQKHTKKIFKMQDNQKDLFYFDIQNIYQDSLKAFKENNRAK